MHSRMCCQSVLSSATRDFEPVVAPWLLAWKLQDNICRLQIIPSGWHFNTLKAVGMALLRFEQRFVELFGCTQGGGAPMYKGG